MLVLLGSNLQFHRVSAVVTVTGDGLGPVLLALVVCVASVPVAVALDGLAIFLQLFGVVGDDFIGSVVGDEFRGDNFQRESGHGEIYVGALLVVAVVFRRGPGAGIEGQARIANIGLFADVQIAQR